MQNTDERKEIHQQQMHIIKMYVMNNIKVYNSVTKIKVVTLQRNLKYSNLSLNL